MIEIEHLTKRYGDITAVSDLSIRIESGQIYGFLGPNGAGKSTTMNMMTGCLSATEGHVRIGGYDIFEQPNQAKRLIGYLPEQPPLYMNETPEEYLRFVGEAKGLHGLELKNQIEEVMEQTGIERMRGRRISALSKGYRQRVGIAQAILHDPKFVVLDEPTNGLDPNQILEVRQLIRNIAEEHTVMLSTHILSEVQATCSTIKMIEHGRVVFSGSVEEFDNYIEPNTLYAVFDLPPLPDELLMIAGIKKVEMVGGHGVRLWYDGERDTIKQVIRESMVRGWEMTEIRSEKSSMEAVFAKLSGK